MIQTKVISPILFVSFLLLSQVTLANWSWNLGYHNPPSSTVGLNFMYLWSHWSFEAGVGYLGSSETNNSTSNTNNNGNTSDSNNNKTAQVTTSGDINIKYLFSYGTFRPYLQGGMGTAASVSTSTGASASAGNNFFGAGFFIMGSSVYFYTSYLFNNGGNYQVGIGFN